MSLSDSMFLFEIVVEEIESFIHYYDFSIVTQFADVFSLQLKNPNDIDVAIPKRPQKKKKRKVRQSKGKIGKSREESKVRIGQSVLISNNLDSLMSNMKTYPMQLFLCPKSDPEYTLGSTNIPWGEPFIDYLNNLMDNQDVPPVSVDGRYNVFDEISSKRMATIKMSIKLSCLKDKVTTQFRSLSGDDNPQTFMYTGYNSNPTRILSTVKEKQEGTITEDTGIIKTIYSGGKKFKHSSRNKDKLSEPLPKLELNTIQPKRAVVNLNRSTEIDETDELNDLETKDKINEKIVDLVKSDTDLEVNKQVAIRKSKSYSSLEYESHLNTLNYIFGDHNGPYGNQVYCVGYFTVQSDKSPSKETVKTTKSSEKSFEPKEKYKFKICDSECPSKKAMTGTSSLSHCSLDLPADAAPRISITKCSNVECNAKKHREPPTPPDDRVLIDLSSLKRDCCAIENAKGGPKGNVTEKVETVIGGVSATMKIGQKDPCFCSCECRFGFTKKTTYCNICGGYEIAGDELSRRPGHDMPFPCPIFHKLIDKNKGKPVSASGSDTKSRKQKSTGGESDKENKKGKKKKKDDRFKFNYGYQAPQIGHSHCAMPCTGTLGNVPKRMGWLWTAEDIPGMKEVAKGWRPGAISRRLLRKLNKAKLQQCTVQGSKSRLKKTKKRADNKPTLIICKVNGEYIVEMQVTGENGEGNVEQYDPLVYRIARENNKEQIAKLERKKRHLVREAVGDAWQDPYHPEVCETRCLKAYQQAVGLLPFDPNNPECICGPAPEQNEPSPSCSCDDDDLSSICSSMAMDWEIHFTPPSAYKCIGL